MIVMSVWLQQGGGDACNRARVVPASEQQIAKISVENCESSPVPLRRQ
jgi:hypothetical protein